MTRSPDGSVFLVFLVRGVGLGLVVFLGLLSRSFVSLESFASLSSAELLSPSEEADEDDPAEPAPFFG